MEQSADGVGVRMMAEDMTKDAVCTPSVSKAKARTKAKAKETVKIVDRLGLTQGGAPTSQGAGARAKDSKERRQLRRERASHSGVPDRQGKRKAKRKRR